MSPRKARHDRPLTEQHEEWTAHLRRQVVSRRTDPAVAATLAATGTIAGGFVVNGRHLSFGDDPATEMRAGGQLVNLLTYNAIPPRTVRVVAGPVRRLRLHRARRHWHKASC